MHEMSFWLNVCKKNRYFCYTLIGISIISVVLFEKLLFFCEVLSRSLFFMQKHWIAELFSLFWKLLVWYCFIHSVLTANGFYFEFLFFVFLFIVNTENWGFQKQFIFVFHNVDIYLKNIFLIFVHFLYFRFLHEKKILNKNGSFFF